MPLKYYRIGKIKVEINQKYAFKILPSRKNHKGEYSTFKVERLFRKYIKRMSFEISIIPNRKNRNGNTSKVCL